MKIPCSLACLAVLLASCQHGIDPDARRVVRSSEYLQHLQQNYTLKNLYMGKASFDTNPNNRWRADLYPKNKSSTRVPFRIDLSFRGSGTTISSKGRPKKTEIEEIIESYIEMPFISEFCDLGASPRIWLRSHLAFDDDESNRLPERIETPLLESGYDYRAIDDWSWIQVNINEDEYLSFYHSPTLEVIILQAAWLSPDHFDEIQRWLTGFSHFEGNYNLFRKYVLIQKDKPPQAVSY